jgi:hypothetical protein
MAFPSALLDEALFADMLAKAPQTRGLTSASVHFFTCGTDVLQEAVETLRRAYRYFKLVNDDVRIAKTVARIAAIYLERVFPPVAFLEQRYEDVSRFQRFTVVARRRAAVVGGAAARLAGPARRRAETTCAPTRTRPRTTTPSRPSWPEHARSAAKPTRRSTRRSRRRRT